MCQVSILCKLWNIVKRKEIYINEKTYYLYKLEDLTYEDILSQQIDAKFNLILIKNPDYMFKENDKPILK